MKFFIYTSLIFGLCLSACSTSKKTPKTKNVNQTGIPLAPEIFSSKIERILTNSEGKDSTASFIAYDFYSMPKSMWQDSANYWIGDFMHATSAMESENYQYETLTHQYFYHVLSQFEENFKSLRNASESQGVWFYEANVKIDEQLQNYVQVKCNAAFYTGGAHPNTNISNAAISKENGAKLKLRDLTSDVSKFNQIAEKYFRLARELSPTTDLKTDFWFENGVFSCNDNFFIDSSGITFTFNAYEVAPYYFGSTEFTVPLSEVSSILKIKI